MVTAAVRAQEAGYDGVEVMGSEGYFLNQFLSLHTNRRVDDWGGSFANRMRLPVAVVRRVRAAVGDSFILIYRISLIDLVPEGQRWDEIVMMARAVAAAGASVLNTGIGWHEARVPTIATSVPRAAFSWLTARLRPLVSIPVIASNRINLPEVAERILERGEADMVSMARPFLADPDFVVKAATGRAAEIAPCIGCNQACLDHTFSGRLTSCLVNPRACHELELRLEPVAVAKRIAVVGAGAAGMACAIAAAGRGHQVVLFEQAGEVGGQLRLAALVPGKEEFLGLIRWFAAEVLRVGVDLRLNSAPGVADLVGFDAVVVATGVAPRLPGIAGEERAVSYPDALRGAALGRRVAIIGAGGIGFDVATKLAQGAVSPTLHPDLWRREWGVGDPALQAGGLAVPAPEPSPRQIFLLQRKAERPGKGLGKTTGWIHRAALQARGVVMQGGADYVRIAAEGLVLRRDGGEELLAVDDVVLCSGQVSVRGLAGELAAAGVTAQVIGGADLAVELDAKRAIDQGVRLAAVL